VPPRISTFPAGGPGWGLFLLRAAASAAAVAKGVSLLGAGADSPGSWVLGALALAGGVGLLAGVLTPWAGVATAGVALAAMWVGPVGSPRGWPPIPADLFLAVMAAALVLLGPGAQSFDARLFGRREIVVPRAARAASERGATKGGDS